MRSKFFSLILAPVVMAAAAFTATTAFAETSTTVKVPFSFTVAGKTCPPGVYSVKWDSSTSLLKLLSADASKSFSWVAGPGEFDANGNHVVLLFDSLDQTHTLRSIRYGSRTTSRLDKKNKSDDAPTMVVAGQ